MVDVRLLLEYTLCVYGLHTDRHVRWVEAAAVPRFTNHME